MPYLLNETTRLQAESQAAEADVTRLTDQVTAQQQAVVAAQTRVTTARSTLAEVQAQDHTQRPELEAAAATADQRVVDLDQQIENHLDNVPVPSVPANPAWQAWNTRHKLLIQQRAQAQATATAAHIRVNNLNTLLAHAAADVQTAETQAAQEGATLTQLNQTLTAARDRAVAARQRVTDLTRLSDEIDREPMNRTALEHVAAELSARVMALEDDLAAARVVSAAAEATLASLLTRRDQVTASLAAVNPQLPAAEAAMRAASLEVRNLTKARDFLIQGGPFEN